MKEKAVKFARKIPNGKAYLEVITAALSIPVLLTVIILNFSNLNNNKKATNTSPTPSVNEKVIYVPEDGKTIATPTSSENCKKQIGPVKISFPSESETVTDNPVYFNIDYTNKDYCSVVWSYRINGGSWSSYTANNPVIYNIPNGNVKFELKVQSTVVQEETVLTRSFTYRGTPTATSSATTN
jgi:hypothetical protein